MPRPSGNKFSEFKKRLAFLWACLYPVLILLVCSKTSSAQVYVPFFKTIKTEQGLSHNKVNRIMEDSRGFIWIGTEDGLNRYDGRYFKVFRREEKGTQGISGNIINDLYEDKEGVIWIATTDGGLSKYDYRLEPNAQFKQYKYKPNQKYGIPENIILKIVESNGYLWLATSKSFVVRFNKSTERFDMPVKVGTRAILSMLPVGRDTLLVGRAGGGMLHINTHNLEHKQDDRYKNLYANLPHASISGMYMDRKKRLWIGSWDNKLYRYGAKDYKQELPGQVIAIPAAQNDEVVPYAEDAYGQIWMGSLNSGVLLNDGSDNYHSYRYNAFKDGTIANDHINHIYISRSGIVWIGTNNGLSTYNPLFSPFKQYNLPRQKKDIVVNDFYKDEADRLWVATSQGLFMQPKGSETFEHRKLAYKGQPLNISKIFRDEDNTFYLGTDYTLFIYDPLSNKLSLLPNTEKDPVMSKIISSRIVSIVRDTIGNHPVLLVSPYGHYFTYYDLVEKQWVSRADKKARIIKKFDIRDNLIQKFKKSPSGEVWIATNKFGLGNWDVDKTEQIKYYGSDENNFGSLRTSHVYDILQDKATGFWISTYGGGLNYFDQKSRKFTHVLESTNITEGIEKDDRGNIWTIANGHIHKYDPRTKIYGCYDLPGLRQNGGLKGYVYRDRYSKLYAGGTNTFVVFDPDKIAEIDNEPAIFLTDFQIFNTSYSQYLNQKSIKLDYEQNYFSIEYAAPDFTGDNVFYTYKLEGLDRNWTQAGKRNYANYANIPGGKYIFKVRATNWKTNVITNFAAIEIVISPPFWMEWWFYLLLVVAFVAIGLIVYFFKVGEIIKRQTMRNGIARDLHDHVGSTLSSILVYTEVAKNYQEHKKPAQLTAVLHSIETVSTEMISEMADIVWAINPKNDHLYYIVQRIKSYAMPLSNAVDINFQVSADEKLLYLPLDMKARKNLYLILKESVNNAIKYSGCKNLKLSIVMVGKALKVSLTDDGIGFSLDQADDDASDSLSGNGLKNLHYRAEELSGKLDIITAPNRGTTISILFTVL